MVPTQVYQGGQAAVALSWAVPAGNRYLGAVLYRTAPGAAVIGNTALFVDAAAPAFGQSTLAEIDKNKPAR